MVHHIVRMTCDSHHNFAAIQGNECVTNCLNFCTLWEGVCTYLFSLIDYVFRSEYVGRNNNSNKSPSSSDDELQGASPLVSYRDYIDALVHDRGVHNFFTKLFRKKQFNKLIQVKKNTN